MAGESENPKLVAVREFPRRLLRARKDYEITNEIEDYAWATLANTVGMSTTVMSQVKTGARPPTLEEVVLFADHFGVRPEWLAFGSGEMREGAGKRPTADQEQRTTVVNGIESERPGPKNKRKRA